MAFSLEMEDDDILEVPSSVLAARSASRIQRRETISGSQETGLNENSYDKKEVTLDEEELKSDREKLEVEFEWEAEEDSDESSKQAAIPLKLSTCVIAISLIIKLKHITRPEKN